MKMASIVGALLLAGTSLTPAAAKVVTLSGSGQLSSAFGTFSIGDPFSFSTSYDDASPGTIDGDIAFYEPAGFFDFTVNGMSFSNEVIYFTTYNAADASFGIGSVGDSSPRGGISILTGRGDAGDLSLPGAVELNNKPGTFSFFAPLGVDDDGNPLGGGGSGSFVTIAAPVPEPSAWAMMLVGFAGVGLTVRRRRRETVRQAEYA